MGNNGKICIADPRLTPTRNPGVTARSWSFINLNGGGTGR